MVEVKQGALGAFEEYVFAPAVGIEDDRLHVGDVGGEPLAELEVALAAAVGIDGLGAINAGDDAVLVIERGPDAGGKVLGAKEVADPDASPGHLVDEAGADALAGRADGGIAAKLLVKLIDEAMPGHDHVGAVADDEA